MNIKAEAGSLRPVVIDGSNVARQLGKKVFATRGILICARYFISRGHHVVTFVPQFRRSQREDNFKRPMTDKYLLDWMSDRNILVYTPSRVVTLNDEQRRRIICYDDYNIVQYAHETGGVIVSKDQYRDVIGEHPEWGDTVRDRLVMFSWVGEMFMVAEDPFGRRGPRLAEILRYAQDEMVVPFTRRRTDEDREKLLREIDEILAAPPPTPPDASTSAGEPRDIDVAELVALSEAPRFGFRRKDADFNHRSRRWMTHDADQLKNYASTSAGFGAVNRNSWMDSDASRAAPLNIGSRADSTCDRIQAEDDSEVFSQWFASGVPKEEDWGLETAVSIGASSTFANSDAPTSSQDSATSRETTVTPNNVEIDSALFEHFRDAFPSDVVVTVLTEYKNIKDLELLSNLLADALLSQ